ncbi:hypothetical protein R69658_00671 [Paraburkholderia aspalathi]|nr:hypothetical protein R69658_00671 [Paraburkholderia aspalathi]
MMARVPKELRIRLDEILMELEPYVIPSEPEPEGRPRKPRSRRQS